MGQSGVVISYWLVSVFIDSRRGTTLATPSRTHHTAMHPGAKSTRRGGMAESQMHKRVCSAFMRWRTFLAPFNDSALADRMAGRPTLLLLLQRYFQSDWTIKANGENYMQAMGTGIVLTRASWLSEQCLFSLQNHI
jgi:hypothetical protein